MLGWLLLCCAAAGRGDAFAERARPVLAERCFACHSGADPDGELGLDRLRGDAASESGAWSAVRRRVRAHEMPPDGEPQPTAEERAELLAWIDAALGPEVARAPVERPVLRRLNRREYVNTVRDLFGVSIDPADLPPDDIGHGFDTIGEVLATSELLLEQHLRLAERVAERAVLPADAPEPPRARIDGAKLGAGRASSARGRHRGLFSNGEVTWTRRLPRDGEYAIRARVHGDQAGPDPCRLALRAGPRELLRADVPERAPDHRIVEVFARLPAGTNRIAVAFLNDYYVPDDPDPAQRDRNLVVEWLEIEGPLDPPAWPRYQREELDPATRGTLRDVVARLLRRAWRRPPDAAEVDAVLALAEREEGLEARARAALVAALASPHFLYRVERDAPTSGAQPIDDHALAVRLAYFLWSSAPDAELDAAADADMLDHPAILRGQVRRLIADARSTALAEGFAVQWLQLGRFERAAPDPAQFPGFDEGLRASMRAEATLLFDAVLREDRRARDLLDPGFTFVDERLAAHYGIEGVRGGTPRRVRVTDGVRGGILGLGAVLTATSYPTRTSPSSRGKFVLEALLGAPPPPPPPGVGVLDESAQAAGESSLRERLERHRGDPGCAACHQSIDPLGFGLENLDAAGRWRTREGRHPIDARGVLPDGRAFDGPAELQRLVADDPAFVRCLAQKLAVYALGYDVDAADRGAIDAIVEAAGKHPTLAGLIEALVLSPRFRQR